ncbi:hypothetical protein EON65_05090 [archaeon]|nr:MAG: hypothetical protein EON65_05090 [archaeon]
MQHLVATNSADTVANASLNVYDGESIHTEDYESARTGNSIYMEEGIQMPVRAEGMSLQSKKTQSLPVVKQKKLLQILGKIRGFLARNSH